MGCSAYVSGVDAPGVKDIGKMAVLCMYPSILLQMFLFPRTKCLEFYTPTIGPVVSCIILHVEHTSDRLRGG